MPQSPFRAALTTATGAMYMYAMEHETHLNDPKRDELAAALDAAFGAWKDHPETGEEYVERIRAGDRLTERWADRRADLDEAR